MTETRTPATPREQISSTGAAAGGSRAPFVNPAGRAARNAPLASPVARAAAADAEAADAALLAAASAHIAPPRTARPALRSSDFLNNRWVAIGLGAVVPVLLLIAWQLVTALGLVPLSQLPSPEMVWLAAVDLAERGLLGLWTAISVQRVLIGFAIGAGLGLVVGAIVGLSRLSELLLSSSLGAIRAVPSLAWLPLLILWMKLGEESKITLIAIGAFFPVYTMVASSLRHVDRQLVEAGRAFGLNGVKLFTTVQLPAVIPSVISGLRLALAQAWLFLVAAELLGASMGLGFMLSDSSNSGRLDRTFLAIIMLAVLGKLSDSLVSLIEKKVNKKWA